MLNTADLHRLVVHAEQRQWRLALVGDPHQLQAVGRGGMFQELCYHRPHDRTRTPPPLHQRVGSHQLTPPPRKATPKHSTSTTPSDASEPARSTTTSTRSPTPGPDAATTARRSRSRPPATNTSHAINHHIQQRRIEAGELDQNTLTPIDDDWAMVGDIVATRRNDRRLRTTTGEPVRNRERWTITDTNPNGEITVTRLDGHGTITLPADYVRQHVQLAYATTEHGAQGDTADRSITLATTATTGRGLYVGMTRGRDENHALVVTDTPDLAEAISILEAAIAIDRADIPATTHRRTARRSRAEVGATASCPDPRLVRRVAGDGRGAASSRPTRARRTKRRAGRGRKTSGRSKPRPARSRGGARPVQREGRRREARRERVAVSAVECRVRAAQVRPSSPSISSPRCRGSHRRPRRRQRSSGTSRGTRRTDPCATR